MRTIALAAVLSVCFAGVAQATPLPAWLTDNANGTIDFPSAISAGNHSADSTPASFGSATYTNNSGAFNNWLMSDGAIYSSVPGGSPLDMEYGKSRTVDLTMLDPSTLQITQNWAYGGKGPACGEGDDHGVESQFLRITAQADIEIEITLINAFAVGGGDPGSGGSTGISFEGGFYEDGVQLSPTVDGTYNLTAGKFYDIFSLREFDVHENDCAFPDATWGFSGESIHTITVVPEPASLSLFAFGALALLRRRR